MIKRNYLENYYFYDEHEVYDEFCETLTCFDQCKYFILREYNCDYRKFFCNDLCIKFLENSKEIDISTFQINDAVFLLREAENIDEPIEVLTSLINQGYIPILQTNMALLPPFIWYQQSSHFNHAFMIFGHDKDNFYFSDSPWVLKKERLKLYNNNPTIFELSKSDVMRACENFSKISVFVIQEEELDKLLPIKELLDKIVKQFHNTASYHSFEGEVVYVGREALIRVIHALESDDSIIENSFFSEPFMAHIMYNRRLNIKYVLENHLKDRILDRRLKNLISNLLKSSEIWESVKSLVMKNQMVQINDFRILLLNRFKKILEVEENMVESIYQIIKYWSEIWKV